MISTPGRVSSWAWVEPGIIEPYRKALEPGSGSHPLHLGKRTNFMYSQEVAECFDEKPVVDAEHPLPAGTYHCKG